jgi:ATP-dependent DNA ligase
VLRLDGEDLRYMPLMERKAKLSVQVSNRSDRSITAITSK